MGAGRPKKVIDYIQVEKLAALMCTQQEIANFLDLNVRTLQRDSEFSRIYKKGMDKGKMSLRRHQFKLAENNASMAIWLGKQHLDQTDAPQVTLNKIKAETEKLKAQTKLIKGVSKDTGMLDSLIGAIKEDDD